MGKAINAFVSAQEEESKEYGRAKLTYKEFEPTYLPERKKQFNPHERVVTELREVKYLRDGYIKEEGDIKPRKIVLETHGTEIVSEVLVPRGDVSSFSEPKIVGSVTRDLRKKESTEYGN
jgi:hypothetical protein